jgi:orotidine-5'-phosphate decarboxylase
LHDIPNTVQKALKTIVKLKPLLTTIHISGGDEMQKVSAKLKKNKTKILGVTILTSLDSMQTKKYYNNKNINQLVRKFAQNAKNNNLDGIVCSPLELRTVRKIVGSKMLIVVPGIRLEKNKKDDQKRILKPKEAINLGADYLVIGRPIVESINPLKTLKEINKSIKSK